MIITTVPSISPAQWTQLGPDIDGEAEYDESGRSVALTPDGSRVAIGGAHNSGNGYRSGHVRVYEWEGVTETWEQLGADIDGEAMNDGSGYSVAFSSDGSKLAIGAPGNDDNGVVSGHVRVYEWDDVDGTWGQLGADIDGESAGDSSGESVSLSADGSRLGIGAPWNDGNGNESGHVRVYGWIGGNWIQRGSDIDGEAAGDRLGSSVALSSDGKRLAVGGPHNAENGIYSGHVRVFQWHTGLQRWLQLGPDIDGGIERDYFGTSVAFSSDGSRLAIGAPGRDGNGSSSGSVRVYSWIDPNWVQLGLEIDGESAADYLGVSVALSNDGSRLAVGAPQNDPEAGYVQVLELGGPIGAMDWDQLGMNIVGEGSDDRFGTSVAISSNGIRVAAGAFLNGGSFFRAGHVRVHVFGVFADGFESGDTSAWSHTSP